MGDGWELCKQTQGSEEWIGGNTNRLYVLVIKMVGWLMPPHSLWERET